MDMKDASGTSTRRRFLMCSLPAGTLACLGCARLAAFAQAQGQAQAPSPKHKFVDDSKMSFEEVYRFAFKNGYIPVMNKLANDVGREKFLEMLKKAASEATVQQMRDETKNLTKRDLATFVALLKEDSYFWKHVITFELVEETEKAAEIKVTECLWAKTFREADAADIGYAAICSPDYAYAPAFNPKMKMIRTKTLMQGHDCCNHRWVMEG